MKRKNAKIENILDVMAEELSGKARAEGVLLPDYTNAFKAITAYLAVKNRLKPPEDDDKGAFGGHADKIANLGRSGGAGSDRPNGSGPEPDF